MRDFERHRAKRGLAGFEQARNMACYAKLVAACYPATEGTDMMVFIAGFYVAYIAMRLVLRMARPYVKTLGDAVHKVIQNPPLDSVIPKALSKCYIEYLPKHLTCSLSTVVRKVIQSSFNKLHKKHLRNVRSAGPFGWGKIGPGWGKTDQGGIKRTWVG